MADIVNQQTTSTLALQANRLSAIPTQPSWGFPDSTGPNALSAALSRLQNTYSVDGIPNVRIVDFNRAALNGSTTAGLNVPSRIDELDTNAPNLTPRGVVSQIYKSPRGRQYKDLGPRNGRY
jgi:hypothetical protein